MKHNTHRRIIHEKINRVPDRHSLLQAKVNLEIRNNIENPPVIKNAILCNLDKINRLLKT